MLFRSESINDYKTAQDKVKSWDVGSPCFISLCGVKKGEACVVELGSDAVYVREMGDKNLLIQTNHYDLESSPFTQHNEKPYEENMNEPKWYSSELLKNSQKRKEIMIETLSKDSDIEMKDRLIELYKNVPVLNYETAQWTLMKPSTGEIEVYACIDK